MGEENSENITVLQEYCSMEYITRCQHLQIYKEGSLMEINIKGEYVFVSLVNENL